MLTAPLSYEGLRDAGAGMGAAGFIVFDDTRNMTEVAYWVSAFLHVESCGQCPACKLGTREITHDLYRMLSGRGEEHDLELMSSRMRNVDDAARCTLPVQERTVISSILRAYPEDVAAALEGTASLVGEPLISKLVDIDSKGVATVDERQAYKRPDWTYAEEPVFIGR
jgi:NADH:ubiquinone oxidoreductase subunit F (NADH-binding)